MTGFSTRAIHAGQDPDPATGAVIVPVYQTSTFAQSAVGQFLRSAVRETPYFIARSTLAQSLLFLAEFTDRIETAIAEESNEILIVDRGYWSKYVYQELVLGASYSRKSVATILDGIFLELPPPSTTILLTASSDVLKTRLLERGEEVDRERSGFMDEAQARLLDLVPDDALVIDTSACSPADVLNAAWRGLVSLGHPYSVRITDERSR